MPMIPTTTQVTKVAPPKYRINANVGCPITYKRHRASKNIEGTVAKFDIKIPLLTLEVFDWEGCGPNNNKIGYGLRFSGNGCITKIVAIIPNGSVSPSASSHGESSSVGEVRRGRSSYESLFCYNKPIPEERIEEPVGTSLAEKVIGDKPRCTHCQAKGAVLCTTCTGSGLYVDSILESQGIIVKVVVEQETSCAHTVGAEVMLDRSGMSGANFLSTTMNLESAS
ncbi:unnamed protein product [Dovyalis caffra]|uniref:Uncharacterized protein n=1 Tax=Dovyalis caffra TaxID=77055 RepID=A0AAV1RZH5_9ROSI|nr:unnamed protein product [Dovyalis caffra]